MTKAILAVSLLLWAVSASAAPSASQEQASRLFHRLSGVPLSLTDPRRPLMERWIELGEWDKAARIATEDEGFINTTVRHWAAPLGRRAEDAQGDFSDFEAMILGTVRDDRDFREILFDDFTYLGPPVVGNKMTPEYGPRYYAEVEKLNPSLVLRRRTPQVLNRSEAAGVLTSDGWGSQHLNDGTNRRAIAFAFREFLCRSIDELADGTVPDFRVHRDVDRAPGGLPGTYAQTCRRCHAGMDALAGAYAFYRSDDRFLISDTGAFFLLPTTVKDERVVKRMNKNGEVFAQGYVTIDDSWINLWTTGKNADLGWRGPTSGHGIHELGKMLSETKAFSRCQAKRVFTQVCLRPPTAEDDGSLATLADGFEADGYRMRRLFEKTAVLPQCLGSKRNP